MEDYGETAKQTTSLNEDVMKLVGINESILHCSLMRNIESDESLIKSDRRPGLDEDEKEACGKEVLVTREVTL